MTTKSAGQLADRLDNIASAINVGPNMEVWMASNDLPTIRAAAAALRSTPQAGVREKAIRECAEIAARYGDLPCSGPHNNTLEAFNHGMNHSTGCVDSACCIEEAILALSAEPQAGVGDNLADLIREYASDLRRNSSGGDEYQFELMRSVADYLEILIGRAALRELP